MKRPAFQFYGKDWRNNAKLRLCSWAARGVWVEVICLMHDNEAEYGLLRASLRDIANAVGCPLPLVKELAAKGVMKGSDKALVDPYIYRPSHAGKKGAPVTLVAQQDGPIWFSSRLVRDEYLRSVRGQTTRYGYTPNGAPNQTPEPTPNHPPNPPNGGGSGYGAAVAVAFAVDTSVVGVMPEVGDPSPPSGEIRPNGNGSVPKPPQGWRQNDNAIMAYGSSLGPEATPLPGQSREQALERIDAFVAKVRRASH